MSSGRAEIPATGEVIGHFHDGGAAVAEAAVHAASSAFRGGTWALDPMLRSTALSHLADAYVVRLDDVVDTLCLENGKLRYEAVFEANFIIRGLRFAAGLAVQTFGRVSDPRPGLQSMSIRQPRRRRRTDHPVELTCLSLHTKRWRRLWRRGCTAAIKMPAEAAQSAALLSEIISSIPEIPVGVVNVFTESGSEGAPPPGGLAPGPCDQLHRKYRYGPCDRAGCGGASQACWTGARRQDAAPRVRRRGP